MCGGGRLGLLGGDPRVDAEEGLGRRDGAPEDAGDLDLAGGESGAVHAGQVPDGDNLDPLFDVLMHEIGHHLIQHYKGKRTVRRARTADHEAFADRFAQRCRLAYRRDGGRPE